MYDLFSKTKYNQPTVGKTKLETDQRISVHHHQPINAPTAGAQAFLMVYT
jgi:hypothetical protein